MESSGNGRIDAYPRSSSAWYACAVLATCSALAVCDRGIIGLFVIPAQRDLNLTDTQISVVIGLAFGLFNALFGLPVARWVDKGSRTFIIFLGVVAWSIATVACGLAANFWQLFTGRMAVGVGEATLAPSAVSLLADLFPPSRRAAARGIFYGGIFIGSGGALLIGGLLWRLLGDRIVALPLVGAFHSWQAILFGAGLFGLIVAPLTSSLREPRRLERGVVIVPSSLPIATVAHYYRRHARTMIGHSMGLCLQNFPVHAGAVWIPTLLVRTLGWTIAEAGTTYGVMTLILGPMGSATAGLLADFLARRGRTDGKLMVCIGAAVACALSSALLVAHCSSITVVTAIGLLAFFGTFVLPMAPGALQDIMPNGMRGQATAIYLAFVNIVTGSLAATSVALLTDYVFQDKSMLCVALGLVCLIASCGAVVLIYLTLRPFRLTADSLADLPISLKPVM